MARHIVSVLSAFLVLYCAFVPSYQARAAGNKEDNTLACLTTMDHPAKFSYGSTEVLVCSSTVQSGSQVHLVIRSRKYSRIHVQILFPDGTSSILDMVADKQGVARPDLPVRYKPITRYAQAQLIVTVMRPGQTDVVPGSLTIAQAIPLSSTRVRARPSYISGWCPADRAACTIRNGSTLIIQVDSDPGAQVAVNLLYPDGTSLPCPANTLTGTAFTSNAGIYRCQLPVVYQGKAKDNNGNNGNDKGSTIQIAAQVSAGGYTQSPRPLRLGLTGR